MALRQVFTQIVQGVSSAINALARIRSGYKLNTTLRTRTSINPGFRLDAGILAGRHIQKVGVRFASFSSGAWKPAVRLGRKLTTVAGLQGTRVARGVQVVQIKIDLVGTYGAATATNTTVSGAAWTNPTNAQGVRNGTLSSHAGSATSAQDARLDFVFPAITNKDALTITKVEVKFYVSQTGTTLNNGLLQAWTGTVANPTEGSHLGATGDVNHLTTPVTADVTSRFPTWESLANLRARVRHLAGTAALTTGNVDAVELIVTATRTDTL